MKDLTVQDIAGTLVGQVAGPESELRLLRLFKTDARDQVEAEPVPMRAPLAKAA
jgi:hypothetical protein